MCPLLQSITPTRQEQYVASKKRLRSDPVNQETEQVKNRDSKRLRRCDHDKAEHDRNKSKESNQHRRNDPVKAEVDRDKSRESNRSRRSDPDKAEVDREKGRVSKQFRRSDPGLAEVDREKGRVSKQARRSDPDKAEVDREKGRVSKQFRRSDPDKAEVDREKGRASKQFRRSDPDKAEVDRTRASAGMEKNRRKKNTFEISHASFPPEISTDTIKTCIDEFKECFSAERMQFFACAICGIDSQKVDTFDINMLSNTFLLKLPDGQQILPEYDHFDITLEPAGINGQEVNCCTTCLNALENGTIPQCSIVNGLQIGTPPEELMGLTIGEKLLIATVRPSVQIVKFKEIAGAGSEQRGIKGNTICFPQDISSIAKEITKLPHDIDELCEYMKVVFVGSKEPTKLQLLNVLKVRRQKVVAALKWLKKNHPQYKNISINQTMVRKIPTEDIPDCIWTTLAHDKDIKSEQSAHANYTNATIDDVIKDNQDNTINTDSSEVIMEGSGVIDVEGTMTTCLEQTKAAVEHLLSDKSRLVKSDNASNLDPVHVIPHGSTPVIEYNNPDLWTGAYPWLFPYGTGGPEGDRLVPLSMRAWIKHLLLLHRPTFREDQMFYFHVFNVIQKREVSLQASICVRQPNFGKKIETLNNLDSHRLENSLTSLVNDRISDPDVKLLLNQIHVVGGNVIGTPYAKRKNRLEIQGGMINLGMPAFWVTLNPAEVHSPVVSFMCGYEVDLNEKFPEIPSAYDRAKYASKNPVVCARYFDMVVKAFITCLLRYQKEGGGILGNVSGYYGCPEEQGRGALHLHMLIWLEGYRSPTKLREKMNQDPGFKARVIQYLETAIRQHSPFADVIGTANAHDSEDTSSNEWEKEDIVSTEQERDSISAKSIVPEDISCENRLHEAFTVCPEQIIIESNKDAILTQLPPDTKDKHFNVEMDLQAHMLIEHCCIHRHNNTCRKKSSEEFKPDDCRFHYPRDIVRVSEMSGDEICVKRLHPWVNNYERTTLVCMKCNHDIRFLGSGKDCNAAAFYATDYQCKCGLNTHNIMPAVINSMKKIEKGMQENCPDALNKSKLMLVKSVNKIITNREMSGPHVASLLLGNEDKYASHKFRTLNILSFLSWIGETDDEMSLSVQSRFQTDNTGLILLNDISDYIFRGSELKHLSLYKYTMCIEKIANKFDCTETGGTHLGRKRNDRHRFDEQHPQKESHIQRKRSKQLLPRLTWFPPSESGNKALFSKCMLLLFKPFTTKEELKSSTKTWEDELQDYVFDDEHTAYIENIREMHIGLEQKARLDAERHAESEDESEIDAYETDDEYYLASEDEELDLTYEWNMNKSLFDEHSTGESLDKHTSEGVSLLVKATCGDTVNKIDEKQIKISRPCLKSKVKNWKQHIEECKKTQTSINEEIHHTASPNGKFSSQNRLDVLQDVISRFSLNAKQIEAFKLIGTNVINRIKGLQADQILMYLGGAGGTGKTRVIEAIVYLHEILGIKDTLQLSAYTGTASSAIGGKTLSSLAQIYHLGEKRTDTKKLENTWGKIKLLIIDEVSPNKLSIISQTA